MTVEVGGNPRFAAKTRFKVFFLFRCDWVYRRVMSSGVTILGSLVALSIIVACGKGNAERVQPITKEQRYWC